MKYRFQLDKIPGCRRNIPYARLALIASLTKNSSCIFKSDDIKEEGRVIFYWPTGDLINDTSLKLVENSLEKFLTSLYYRESILLPYN
jgi:hypothetical protein